VLLGKGLLLDGRAGVEYVRQRWVAERLISRELFRVRASPPPA